MPIGIFINKDVSFSDYKIEIQKGDIVYIFSDGYQDQFGGIEKKKFLSRNFYNLLLRISTQPLQIQREILEDTLNKWQGSEPQVDDIMVIGFRI